ncbi:MAG: DUF1287 domain-containing protein [bacterium]|nr:DUF1287 domain-containing protein [bacterium]
MFGRVVACLFLVTCAPAQGPAPPSPGALEVDGLTRRLVDAAIERTRQRVRYDGSYRQIPYPGGDVPGDVGVCTDVVIRSYRAVGIDLQKEVHEDMGIAFSAYPGNWGLRRPDPNIDHRRVPNLRTFLRRRGAELPVTAEFRPGDVVTWMLAGNRPHVGLVIDRLAADGTRPLIVHNVGAGPRIDDALLRYRITGHYRYRGG